jgi:hypothetical protein
MIDTPAQITTLSEQFPAPRSSGLACFREFSTKPRTASAVEYPGVNIPFVLPAVPVLRT